MRPLPNPAPRSLAAVALAAACFSGAAAAQTSTITVEAAGASTPYEFGAAACNGTGGSTAPSSIDITYTLGTTYTSQVITAFATESADCTQGTAASGTTPGTGLSYSVPSQTDTSGTIPITLSDLLFGTTCAASTSSSSSPGIVYFCVQQTSGSTLEATGSVEIEYAIQPPDPPVGIVVESGDQQLHVAWTAADTSATIGSYQVYCEPDATDGGTATFDIDDYAAQITSGTSATVDRTGISGDALVNGDSYSVAITATDTFGNESGFSAISSGNIPYPVADFYQYYRDDGGSALGCASSDGLVFAGLAGALAILVWGARARKKRSGAALVALLAGSLLAAQARADDMDFSVTDYTIPTVRPDRRFFFAVEADRYSPQVDSEKDLNGATPYTAIFGDRIPWRVQGELAWEALRFKGVGTLLTGVSVGFWQNIGKGIFAAGPDAGQPSSDTTLLDVWPFGVEAQWRFDGLADRYRWFPFIPYVKAGFMEALWTVYAGNGDVASSPAQSATGSSPARAAGRGQGWTPGYTTALGLALSLDAIDPGISNEAYLSLGLQRTSIFAEYGWTRLDGFRSGGVLILTDRAWRFGLSLEF